MSDSDLISRQDAVNAVHKDYDAILDFKSDGRTVADSFEDIINALPSAQPEPQWIPVSERLPDFGVDVLVTIESDNMRCIAVDYVYERYGEVWACYRNVTAWMELPNPYERKEE